MNSSINKVWAFLGSRLARNIYLWLIIIYTTLNNDNESRTYPDSIYNLAIAGTLFLLFAATNINNFYLIPRFLVRKKRVAYFTLAIAVAASFSMAYSLLVKYMVTKYPGVRVHHVSLISSPMSTVWDLHHVLDEWQTFFFGILLFMIPLTASWFMNDYFRQQKMMEGIQRKQVETELHFLKNQINPHFLFNTLNNLYGLILKNSDKSGDAVLKLSAILRYMLYESDMETVSFEREEEIIKAYIDVELLRLPQGQHIQARIQQDKNYNIPPLLWLPVLENMFKHATKQIADSYTLEYKFIIENDMLHIYSKNNYKPGNADTKDGIGLENLRKRLALLYPGKHDIEIKQDEQFFTLSVQIKLA